MSGRRVVVMLACAPLTPDTVEVASADADAPTTVVLCDALRALVQKCNARASAHTTVEGGLPGVLLDFGPEVSFYLMHIRVQSGWMLMEQQHLDAQLPRGCTLWVLLVPFSEISHPGWVRCVSAQ